MIRKYGWIAVILFGIMLSGCGNESSQTNSENKGKAIEGLSNVAWTFKAEQNATLSQPLVTEDNAYFGTDKTMYVVDTKAGTKKWTRPINGLPSVPALSGNTLIFNDNYGIQAVKADNGEVIWKYDYNLKVPAELKPKAAITSSSHAFIVEQSEDGRSSLKAIDVKTGKVRWNYGDAVPLSGFVLAADKLYVPMQGVIHIIDEKNGKETDSITLDAMISSLSVADNLLYVVDLGGHIAAFDLNSKRQKWQYTIEAFEAPYAPVLTALKGKVVASEVKSGLMIGIDAQSGKELWKIKMGDEKYRPTIPWVITQPSVLEDTLFIGAWDGQDNEVKYMPDYSNLIALDGNTGKELWHFKVDDYIMYPPSFAKGKAIVTNMQETITAFNEGKAPEQAEESKLQDEITIGTIKIGDSEEKMLNDLGMPISSAKLADYSEEFTNGDDRTMYTYQEGTLYTIEGVVYQIDVSRQSSATKSGLVIWDDRAKALALYSKFNNAVANLHQLLILEDGYFFIVEFNGGRASEFTLIDANYRIKPKHDAFSEAEKYKDTALHVNGFGSCGDLNLFRFVKELIDPDAELWNGDEASCYPLNNEQEKLKSETSLKTDSNNQLTEVGNKGANVTVTNNEPIKSFEGIWSTPGSDELGIHLKFVDERTASLMMSQGPGSEERHTIEYAINGKQLLYSYEGGDQLVTLELIDDKTMNFINYDGYKFELKKVEFND